MLTEFHDVLDAANAFYDRHKAFYENWKRNPSHICDEEFMTFMKSVEDLREKHPSVKASK